MGTARVPDSPELFAISSEEEGEGYPVSQGSSSWLLWSDGTYDYFLEEEVVYKEYYTATCDGGGEVVGYTMHHAPIGKVMDCPQEVRKSLFALGIMEPMLVIDLADLGHPQGNAGDGQP